MTESTKYQPIINNGGTTKTTTLVFFSELRNLFSFHKTRKSMAFTYGFVLIFVAFTAFLAFNPSPNTSAPWFTNIFSIGSSSFSINSTGSSHISNSNNSANHDSDKSQLASIMSYIFPNSSQQSENRKPKQNFTSVDDQINSTRSDQNVSNAKNQSRSEGLKQNQTVIEVPKIPVVTVNGKNDSNNGVVLKQNQTLTETPKAPAAPPQAPAAPVVNQKGELSKSNLTSPEKKKSGVDEKDVVDKDKGMTTNFTASLAKKKPSNETQSNLPRVKQEKKSDDMIDQLMNCNLFDGNWIRDETYPLYKPGSCSLIDEQFNCVSNGRPDRVYQQLKWKPKGCTLPRLDAHHMLDLLRGKRLVFVGDSLNRNMWESLVCILKTAVKDQSKVYEVSGRLHFRTEASYSFIFKDYGCTVEFFVSPFLVQEWDLPVKNGSTKETLRLDLIGRSADKYKDADIIIFNTGHWWTHDKTSKGKDYYQEGSHVYGELNVIEAFRKALTTWARWVDASVNPKKSFVFFRGYSASHFSGGQWNSGGQCDSETEPIKNETYLTPYPPKMLVLEKVLKGMKTHVTYLNITRITDYRKDGHPSVYRKKNLSPEERKSPLRFQDCSHWCLPGVPDAWNELLYAELLVRQKQRMQQQKTP